MKIRVELHLADGQCDHCGTKTIHAFVISYKKEKMYIGRACLANLININTSGNPYRAMNRIELYLNTGDTDENWEELFTE